MPLTPEPVLNYEQTCIPHLKYMAEVDSPLLAPVFHGRLCLNHEARAKTSVLQALLSRSRKVSRSKVRASALKRVIVIRSYELAGSRTGIGRRPLDSLGIFPPDSNARIALDRIRAAQAAACRSALPATGQPYVTIMRITTHCFPRAPVNLSSCLRNP